MFKILDEEGNATLDVDTLNLNKNDVLVVKSRNSVSIQDKSTLERLCSIFPENRVVFLPDGYDLGVLKTDLDVVEEKISKRKVLKG